MKRSSSGGGCGSVMVRSGLHEPVVAKLLVERRLADLEAARQLGAREVGVGAKRLLEPAAFGVLEERRQPGREVARSGARNVTPAIEVAQHFRRIDRSRTAAHREPRRELLEMA